MHDLGGYVKKDFAPISSLTDIGAMGRPKNFSREGVLEKALPVFWRRGFADASLHELEVATGVNKSGLYSEFKDKEDLFIQSLWYYLESLEKKGLLAAEPLGWNIEVERPKMDADSLAELVLTFFTGLSMEHNLNSSRPSIVRKIDDLMNIVRTL
jgi:AcrR family transcriptional regulator